MSAAEDAVRVGQATTKKQSTEAKQNAKARRILSEAYAFLRSRKTNQLSSFTLDAAVQGRIDEIEGAEDIPSTLSYLDALVNNLTATADGLRKDG